MSYLTGYLDPGGRTAVVNEAVRVLRDIVDVHDIKAIAFRGMSGALIAPAAAAILNLPLIMVRKQGVSHSMHTVETTLPYTDVTGKYLAIDDIVSSGETLRIIQRDIKDYYPGLKFAGVYLYGDGVWPAGWYPEWVAWAGTLPENEHTV